MCPLYNMQRHSDEDDKFNRTEIDLMNEFRELWEQHSAWTRMTIMSIVFNLPDEMFSTNRLLQNPTDFQNSLMPFYGNEASSRFSDLLKEHLVIAADLVVTAKAGDTDKANETEKKWYDNADEIAALLASINPYWSEDDWKEMLHEHLSLVKSEAVTMLSNNYGESVSVYDSIESQSLKMADTMSEGIIRQFPYEFAM